MKCIMDLHTHTLASGHAYNTMKEMVQAAADRGLKVLGITEHGPKMPGSCQNFYFHNLKILPREMFGVKLLLGSEVNIMDYDGTVDLSQRELGMLDIVIASMHNPCVQPGTMEENTRAYLSVMENPLVDIIGHPDDGRYPVDYETFVKGAKRYHKLIEINNSSLGTMSYRANAAANDTQVLQYCKKYEVPVVVNSDAHYDSYVGVFDNAMPLLKKLDFPEELIINRELEALKPYLHK